MVTREDILKIIKDNVSTVDVENLDCETPVFDQGMDSLDLISTLFDIEEQYDIKIEEDAIDQGKLSSVNAIVAFLNSCIASGN
jgi:acyl carrier protein